MCGRDYETLSRVSRKILVEYNIFRFGDLKKATYYFAKSAKKFDFW